MSTSEAAETPEESKKRLEQAIDKATAGFSESLVTPLIDQLGKAVDSASKLIEQGSGLAKQGPVYAMVVLSFALVATAIGFSEVNSSHPADFIASLVVAAVLVVVAGILWLVNNVTESRAAVRQVSELSSANERIIKYAIDHGAVIVARTQTGLPAPSSPDGSAQATGTVTT